MSSLEQSTTTADDRSEQKRKISFPIEIIEDILSRLPVKTLLQFRSVSKPWRSLISDPSFTKLHFTQSGHRTALFISAYDRIARKRYFLSAAHDGGSVTHLATIENVPPSTGVTTEAEHLNGLVCFTSANGLFDSNYAFVVNPSTHKVFKVPDSASWTNYGTGELNNCYLFGFDESTNEHKILSITIRNFKSSFTSYSVPATVEVSVFSMSNYSWKKISADLPIEFGTDRLYYSNRYSVCVDSVIHFMLQNSFDILTFDLRTEKFSKISTPSVVKAHGYIPRVIKVNGCVGLVCQDVENSYGDIWILHDYERRVWVRETITFPRAWFYLDGHLHFDSVNVDEIIVFLSRLYTNAIIVHIYNMKSKGFRSVHLTLSQPFLNFNEVEFDQIKCYVESIVPVKRNRTRS